MSRRFILLKSIGSGYMKDEIFQKVYDIEPQKNSVFPMYDRIGFEIRPYFEK